MSWVFLDKVYEVYGSREGFFFPTLVISHGSYVKFTSSSVFESVGIFCQLWIQSFHESDKVFHRKV